MVDDLDVNFDVNRNATFVLERKNYALFALVYVANY